MSSQESSGHVKAAVIGGIFAVIAACIGGAFLIINTLVANGFIIVGPSVQAGNPNPQPTAKVTQAETVQTTDRLFFDDFNSGNTAKWASYFTSSYFKDGELFTNGGILSAGQRAWRNYSITLNFKLISGEMDFGVIGRYQDANHFYNCQIYHDEIWIVIQGDNLAEGDFDWLARNPYDFEFGKSYKLRMDVQGDAISCYLSDALVATASDSTYPAGRFGVRVVNTNVALDNIDVFELP